MKSKKIENNIFFHDNMKIVIKIEVQESSQESGNLSVGRKKEEECWIIKQNLLLQP